MTTVLKAANYSADQIATITADYAAGETLEAIAASVGKSVPSVRAKLSSLKVYVSKSKKAETGDKVLKENKEALASLLCELVGVSLLNIEAASKQALLALINAIKQRDSKIESLVSDLLGEDSDSASE